jgi:hypothetical protein
MTPPLMLTSPEKVIYRSQYTFAMNTLGLSEVEASEKARNKILQIRALREEPEMREEAQRERQRV